MKVNNARGLSKFRLIFALGLLWAFITLMLFLRFSDLEENQACLYFCYPTFSAYVVAGAWFEGWYVTKFRVMVGNLKFFVTILLQVLFLICIILAVEFGYEQNRFFALVIFFSALHIGIVIGLYRNSKKKQRIGK
jgi:peptidoglycan/LPS O-acetylase OafA/YrhL